MRYILLQDWFDVPAGTPVSAAMGDLQCSVKSTLEDVDHDAVVNVSTSAQIAFVKPEGFQPSHSLPGEPRTPIEFFPYFEVSARRDWVIHQTDFHLKLKVNKMMYLYSRVDTSPWLPLSTAATPWRPS